MNPNRLTGQVVPVTDLAGAEVAELHALHARLYAAADEARFRTDLAEKDWVVVLRDGGGAIRGYSTLRVLDVARPSPGGWGGGAGGVARGFDGQPLRAVFSGDTGIDPAYWGGQALVRTWASFMGELWARDPARRLFWFLIVKGFRTYLYLPYFFHTFYPRHDRPTPPFETALIGELAGSRYPEAFNPATGLVEFAESHGHLAADLAEVPPHRADDPHVRFFLARNPGYARGHELVCVAEISPTNMKGLARRRLLDGVPAVQLVG
jgi:hypothetical protein